ncbi:MAG TPA: adenosylcobinamide-GDP ribazoletransferase [Anaerolineales bacterium]|nr:adenosylcobinamide-GDP ribazoletransferase [Anaerolineales bacterium]
MIELFAALQFLTIFPPVFKRPFTVQELGRSAGVYPLVGLLLGAVMAGVYWLLGHALPAPVVFVLVLVVWVSFTRALHIDGFMDCCDGLFGGFTPERRLDIMRDSRVGAFGVAGGVLLILAKYVFLTAQPAPLTSLILIPAIGRWALTFGIALFPYARESGMGRDIKDHTRWPQLLLATLTVLAAAWLLSAWFGLVLVASAAVFSFLWFNYVQRLIPGLTGDVYGATCEMVELLMLLISAQILI